MSIVCKKIIDIVRSGRYIVANSLVQRIIKQLRYNRINNNSTILVNFGYNVPSDIAYYKIDVSPNNSYIGGTIFHTSCVKTKNKQISNNKEC